MIQSEKKHWNVNIKLHSYKNNVETTNVVKIKNSNVWTACVLHFHVLHFHVLHFQRPRKWYLYTSVEERRLCFYLFYVCLSVCLFAWLLKKLRTDYDEIFGDSSLVRRVTGLGFRVRVRVSACCDCLTESPLTSIMWWCSLDRYTRRKCRTSDPSDCNRNFLEGCMGVAQETID